MTFKGHTLLAALPVNLYICFNPIDKFSAIIILVGVLIGSILPDIDEPHSYIGKRLAFLSYPLKLFGLKHRTFTHYLIFPLLVSLIALLIQDTVIKLFLFSLSFGILMHDIGDLITKGGITGFFFPLFPNKKIALLPYGLRFYTNSITEYLIIFILFLSNVGIILYKLHSLNIFTLPL
jgi:inner membrane protein